MYIYIYIYICIHITIPYHTIPHMGMRRGGRRAPFSRDRGFLGSGGAKRGWRKRVWQHSANKRDSAPMVCNKGCSRNVMYCLFIDAVFVDYHFVYTNKKKETHTKYTQNKEIIILPPPVKPPPFDSLRLVGARVPPAQRPARAPVRCGPMALLLLILVLS